MTETTALVETQENLPALARPRLPFHPAVENRFGVDRGTWKFLTDVVFPAAEAPESIILALSYCKARRLDILKKPVHIVPVWDKKRGAQVDTVWPSINELRITAMRTGEYVGKAATEFGPLVLMKLGEAEVEFPEWAQVTVWRFVKGHPRAFVGEQVRWLEYYAKAKRGVKTPNEMWLTKSYSQLSKCAEASALRTAFPEELGSERTAEEMEGQEVETAMTQDNEVSSGVMARLNGSAGGSGFSQAAVDATAEPVPGDGRKPRQRKAKDATPGPTETASAQDADAGQGSSASATDASTDSPAETSGQETSEGDSAADETPADDVDATSEGYPGEDEVYHLEGDDWSAEDGRRETYKNGLPFSSAIRKAGLAIYADHAPHQQDGPTPGAEDDDPMAGYPEEFRTYILTVESAPTWPDVKKAMATFYNTDLFKGWSSAQQNKVRADTWDIIQERKLDGVPDQAQDVSAFRLWIEWVQDPDAIQGTFAVLQREQPYAQKDAAFKQAMEANVNNRLAALRE